MSLSAVQAFAEEMVLPALVLALTRSPVTQCKQGLEYLNMLVRPD